MSAMTVVPLYSFIAPTVILFTTLVSTINSSPITVIVPHCIDDHCYKIPPSVNVTGLKYYRSLRKLLSGGLGQLVWESISRDEIQDLDISKDCSSNLRAIWKGIKEGNERSFKILDSSAKTPSAHLDGTFTSYGDFDQCLELSATQDQGDEKYTTQYCTVPVSQLGPEVDDWDQFEEEAILKKADEPRKIRVKGINIFKDHAHLYGLCLPSTCARNDVSLIVGTALKGLPVEVHQDIHCDTKDSVSIQTRLMNLSGAQLVAMSLVLVSMSIVSIISFVRFWYPSNDLLGELSLLHSARQVWRKEPFANSRRSIGIDVMKVLFVYSGGMSHNAYCLETPLALLMMNRHIEFRNMFTGFVSQAFTNEAGLTQIPVLSGFAVFYYVFPLIRKKKFPLLFAIITRFLNSVPPILIVTCLDILWPLFGSGPLYNRVGNFVLNKCSKYWWWNLLLINNFFPPLDICVPQTYFSSTIFQLFVLSVPVMYLYSKDRSLGRKVSIIIVLVGYILFGYHSFKRSITPSMFVSMNPSGQKTVDYLEVATIKIYSYLPGYFFGLIVCDFVMDDFKPPIRGGSIYNIFFLFTGIGLQWIATYSVALFNVVHILPESTAPIFIPFIRFLLHCSAACYIFWIYCLPSLTESGRTKYRLFDESTTREMKENASQSKVIQIILNWYHVFDEWLGLCNNIIIPLSNISVAFYLINYSFIRFDFFTSRVTVTNSWVNLLKRTSYAMTLMTLFAFLFHIYFVAPVDTLIKYLIRKKRNGHNYSNDSNGNHNDDVKGRKAEVNEEEEKARVKEEEEKARVKEEEEKVRVKEEEESSGMKRRK